MHGVKQMQLRMLVGHPSASTTTYLFSSCNVFIGSPSSVMTDLIAPMQASTNTVLAHFASIVFANWLLRILNKSVDKQMAAAAI